MEAIEGQISVLEARDWIKECIDPYGELIKKL